ncbi:hypothetical protein [Micromonospora sp. RP3T]|uniref:hypothetical protein n=1 Tax=Micromonospora sp. RP3T TaxID=2135446 RepID=UPI003D72E01A
MARYDFIETGKLRPGGPPPAEDLDLVAEALAGQYAPAELADLCAIVSAADSTREPDAPAARLLAQLEAAHRDAMRPATPPAPPTAQGRPVAFSVYASPDPDAPPLEVVLGGTERATVVPAGRTDWRLAIPGDAYVGEPAPHAARLTCDQVHPQHDVHHPDGH